MTRQRPAAVVIMAAGLGTRMKSATPKVLHEIGGHALIWYAVEAARHLEPEHLVVVVGNGRERVEQYLTDSFGEDAGISTAVQAEQHGTGDAVRCGLTALPDGLVGTVVVTSGDVPLLAGQTLRALVDSHAEQGDAVTVLTARPHDPAGYGRVLRGPDGAVHGIVEHKDADETQRLITEINTGVYAFDAATLTDALGRLTTGNAQGEFYLTDVTSIAHGDGKRVGAYLTDDPVQAEGVNDRVQLATLGAELNRRRCRSLMRAGVTIVDPETTWIDAGVSIGRDTVVRPHTQLLGATTIGSDVVIGPDVTLTDCEVDDGASVVRCHGELAEIGPGASVGPFAYLRPGTRLGADGKIGTFVETKNADIHAGAKVPHLTYCGDAEIGEQANIGAGTIFANYDGVDKNRTTVGRGTFVGSNSVLVAPVDLADGCYVAAGSAIDTSTEPGQLAVARSRQRNVDGWVARRRAGTVTAEAAEAARTDEAPATDHTPGSADVEAGSRS